MLFFLVLLMIGIGVGTVVVQGVVWGVGDVNDIEIGDNQEQVITDIEINEPNGPVTVEVGELAEAGAVFSPNSSDYDIKNGKETDDSEVFIKNPNSANATIVIRNSALSEFTTFDLLISGIDTANVSKYDSNLEPRELEFSYKIEESGTWDFVYFTVNSNSEVSFSDTPYNSESNSIEFDTLKIDNRSLEQVAVWNLTPDGRLNHRLGSLQKDENKINLDSDSVSGEHKIVATIGPEESLKKNGIIYNIDSTTAEFPVDPQITGKPTNYINRSHSSKRYSVINIPVNTRISDTAGEITLEYFNSTSKSIRLESDKEKYSISDNQIKIYLNVSGNTTRLDQNIETITLSNISSDTGGHLIHRQSQVDQVGRTVFNSSNVSVVQGAKLGFNFNSLNNTSISSVSKNTTYNLTQNTGSIPIFDTTNISTGEYIVRSESQADRTRITISNSSLSADIKSEYALNDISIDFDETKADRHFGISINHTPTDMNVGSDVVLNSSAESSISLNINKTGMYEIQVQDFNSGTSIREKTNILEQRVAHISQKSSRSHIYSGNPVHAEILGTYNKSSIEVINTTNQSTAATVNLTTVGDGTVPVAINTYAAGDPTLTDEFVTVGKGGSVESVNMSTPDGTLPPGTYELAVRSAHGSVTTTDNTTFTVRSRSTDGVEVYTTDESGPDAFDTATDVQTAIETGTLSSSTTASDSDTVVYAVDATGLSGLPTAQNVTLEAGPDVDRVDGFDFGIRATAATEGDQPTAGSEMLLRETSDADDIGSTPEDATVHLDETGLYLVAAGDDAFPAADKPDHGEEFTAAFRVNDDRLRAAADPRDDHIVTADLSYVDTDAAPDPVADSGDNGDARGPSGGGGGGAVGGGGEGAVGGGGGGAVGGDGGGGDVSADPTDAGGAGVTPSPGGATDRNPDADEGGDRPGNPAMTGTGGRVHPVPELVAPHRNYAAPYGGHARAAGDKAGSADRSSSVAADSTTDATASTDVGPTGGREAASDGNASADRFAEPNAPDYENAPIRSTAYDIPGFGPVVTVLAIAILALLAVRRQ